MKTNGTTIFSLLTIALLTIGCNDAGSQSTDLAPNFKGYWYGGKAEVTSYQLSQARYGEMRQGTAVMIFVTEPFSQEKHVKLDNPDQASKDRVEVLKMNFTKDFVTGIYPYHLMTSAFTPVEFAKFGRSIKVTNSVSEWCGQAFSQLDYREGLLDLKQYSYFESDGDERTQPANALLEDEVWNLIRINPGLIAKGETQVIPSMAWCRLLHQTVKPRPAVISKQINGNLTRLTIDYPGMKRTLRINYNTAFPHEIESWEEEYIDGWGKNAKTLVTTGKKMHRLMTDYWNLSDNASLEWRQVLKLD